MMILVTTTMLTAAALLVRQLLKHTQLHSIIYFTCAYLGKLLYYYTKTKYFFLSFCAYLLKHIYFTVVAFIRSVRWLCLFFLALPTFSVILHSAFDRNIVFIPATITAASVNSMICVVVSYVASCAA